MENLETKISCPSCKTKNNNDTKYCSKCGYEFNKKRRKIFLKWLYLLLFSGFFSIIFSPLFFFYFILVLFFANILHKTLKEIGVKYGWPLGLLPIIPILGPLIPFLVARNKLKKIDGWNDNKVKPEVPHVQDQTPLSPNSTGQTPLPSNTVPTKKKPFVPIFLGLTVIIIIIIIIIIISGGGTRNCIKRLSGGFFGEGPRTPECSDYDGKLKNTTLNGRSLGKCTALSVYGTCIH